MMSCGSLVKARLPSCTELALNPCYFDRVIVFLLPLECLLQCQAPWIGVKRRQWVIKHAAGDRVSEAVVNKYI